jgi:hypothetical protein
MKPAARRDHSTDTPGRRRSMVACSGPPLGNAVPAQRQAAHRRRCGAPLDRAHHSATLELRKHRWALLRQAATRMPPRLRCLWSLRAVSATTAWSQPAVNSKLFRRGEDLQTSPLETDSATKRSARQRARAGPSAPSAGCGPSGKASRARPQFGRKPGSRLHAPVGDDASKARSDYDVTLVLEDDASQARSGPRHHAPAGRRRRTGEPMQFLRP